MRNTDRILHVMMPYGREAVPFCGAVTQKTYRGRAREIPCACCAIFEKILSANVAAHRLEGPPFRTFPEYPVPFLPVTYDDGTTVKALAYPTRTVAAQFFVRMLLGYIATPMEAAWVAAGTFAYMADGGSADERCSYCATVCPFFGCPVCLRGCPRPPEPPEPTEDERKIIEAQAFARHEKHKKKVRDRAKAKRLAAKKCESCFTPQDKTDARLVRCVACRKLLCLACRQRQNRRWWCRPPLPCPGIPARERRLLDELFGKVDSQ